MSDPRSVAFAVLFAAAFGAAWQIPWIITGALGLALAIGAAVAWRMTRSRTAPETPKPPPVGMTTGLPLGEFIRSGRDYRPILAGTHAVIGGGTGMGKSNLINCLLVSLANLPDVQILGIDPKGGLELWPWRARLNALATEPDEWLALLRMLRAEIDRRQAILRNARKRELTAELSARLDLPWLVLLIDEVNEVLNLDPDTKRRAAVEDVLMSMISIGRAVGVSIVLATQKPAADSIPTGIRDIAKTRIAFGTTTTAMTDTILGDRATSRGATAHLITTPGVFNVWDPVDARFAWVKIRLVTDEEVRMHASVTDDWARPWNLEPFMTRPRRPRKPRRPSRIDETEAVG